MLPNSVNIKMKQSMGLRLLWGIRWEESQNSNFKVVDFHHFNTGKS